MKLYDEKEFADAIVEMGASIAELTVERALRDTPRWMRPFVGVASWRPIAHLASAITIREIAETDLAATYLLVGKTHKRLKESKQNKGRRK